MGRGERFRVVVLGARFGGLAVVHRLRRLMGDRVTLTVVDQRATAVFRPALVEAMARPPVFVRSLRIPLDRAVGRAGTFLNDRAVAIDAHRRLVHLASRRPLPYDVLFWATGADAAWSVVEGLSPATGGLCEDFLARHAAAANATWTGGRILFVAGPYRADPRATPQPASACECPLYEAAFLFDQALRRHGRRDHTEVVVVSPAGVVGEALGPRGRARLQDLLDTRRIRVVTGARYVRVEPGRLVLADGALKAERMIWIPPYAGSDLARRSGLDDGYGWVPTTGHGRHRDWPDIYAVGDLAARLPKTAHAAVTQARAAVDHWVRTVRGQSPPAPWHPASVTLLDTGDGRALLAYGPGPVGDAREHVVHARWAAWVKDLLAWLYVRSDGRLPFTP
ncbi:MAG: FAD-dependent oxidoreductase [Actinomycetia bacterium]|nr:FAD-dependent oxidoreductase [Actinomycetes bacterium]